jgi:putative LPXTG-motif protein cell wall anchor domain protein
MSLLKTFQTSYDSAPNAADWTLTAIGNFGGESGDTERIVPGNTTVTNANTFVVPVGESFQFKERAAPEVMKGYELLNSGVTAVGGSQVELVNKDKPASATWTKTDSETGEPIGESEWILKGPTAPGGSAITDCIAADRSLCTGLDKDPGAGSFLLEELKWGEHTLTEVTPPPGYMLSDLPEQIVRLSSTDTGTEPFVIGTISNDRLPGSISWRKTEAGTTIPLAGSVWRLTNPSGRTITDIKDCVAPDSCSGPDRDPAPGAFRVEKLSWGAWTLTETSAPLGYLLTTREETLQIGSQALHQTVEDPFENTRAPVPVLPLTGGTPSDIYHYSGGGLLLIAAVMAFLRNRHRKERR